MLRYEIVNSLNSLWSVNVLNDPHWKITSFDIYKLKFHYFVVASCLVARLFLLRVVCVGGRAG